MKYQMITRRGWFGSFPDNQAEGAIPNGERIMKIRNEANDLTPLGTLGMVLASLDAQELDTELAKTHPHIRFVYWVEWDNAPKRAVFVVGSKIGRKS